MWMWRAGLSSMWLGSLNRGRDQGPEARGQRKASTGVLLFPGL